jgi:hypothetical protein
MAPYRVRDLNYRNMGNTFRADEFSASHRTLSPPPKNSALLPDGGVRSTLIDADCGGATSYADDRAMNGDTFSSNSMHQTAFIGVFLLAVAMSSIGSVAQTPDADLNIIADQVRSQGFACSPVSAEHVAAESSPGNEVYVLRCDGVSYRVQIVPDQASKITKLD